MILNPGLQYLGSDSYNGDGWDYRGVFQCTVLAKIHLPPKLKTIEQYTFRDCKNLKEVELCEGIEKLE